MKALVVVLALFVACACAQYASEWTYVGDVRGDEAVKFTFVLKQRNMDKLERLITQITDPASPLYTQYMSKEEILDMIAPEPAVRQSVIEWVRSKCDAHSVHSIVDRGDSVVVESTAACAQSLLSVQLAHYIHSTSGARTVRQTVDSPAPVLPAELKPHVDFVNGLVFFPVVRKARKELVDVDTAEIIAALKNNERNIKRATYNYVIPETCRQLYNIPDGSKATNPKNSQCAVEFYPEGAPLISDMVQFAKETNEPFTNLSMIVGPWLPGGDDGEAILDVEYLTVIGAGAFTWYITIQDGWMYDFATEVFDMPNPPLVHSISYGWPEEDQCGSITYANCSGGLDNQQYVTRANAEFMKLAGRGVSVIVCSQDEGAPSEANEDCEYDDTHPLWPIYPASSPWVTTVSGTTLVQSQEASNPPPICYDYTCADGTNGIEHPCMPNETYYQWTTGGGFAKYAPRPTYQDAAVKAYLASSAIIPPSQFFESANRGYPDVSALGSRILIIQSGATGVTAGTSASTPIFAGMVTLLNDYRLNNGKKPLGFLNPLLYKMAAAGTGFRDITVGNNKCTIEVCCTYGYGATKGWDPVTGLGVPDYGQMLEYIKSLP